MNPLLIKAIRPEFFLCRVSNSDQGKWNNTLRYLKECTHPLHQVFPGVNTHPHCTQSQCFGSQQNILGCCSTVLRPEIGGLEPAAVPTDQNGQRCGLEH